MIFVAILEESQKVDLEEKGILHDCRPIVKPALITPEGGFAYLNQGHIDCLLDYENKENIKELVKRMHAEFGYGYRTNSIFIDEEAFKEEVNKDGNT